MSAIRSVVPFPRKSRMQARIALQRQNEAAIRDRQLNYWRSVRQGIAQDEQRYGSLESEVRYYIALGCILCAIAVAVFGYWLTA